VHLDRAYRSRKQLVNTFKQFEGYYETIFADCPPSLTLLSENIFRASDVLLIPVIPSVLSRRTFEQVRGFLKKKEISIKHVIPFFSMVDTRKRLHREQMDELWEIYPDFVRNYIPYRSEIEKMGQFRAPLPAVHPASRNSHEIQMLWQEIRERISS
jgi:cellulose biosynthesis protein BcsQ